MASLNLAPEEGRALESSRNRLFQLNNSLASLRHNVLSSTPLPSQDSLQSSALILQKSLNSIQQIITENASLFQRLVVHPSTNYPGRTQENILLTLLRKKMEPDVADWADEARKAALGAGVDPSKLGGHRGSGDDYYDGEDEDDYNKDDSDGAEPLTELWEDAREACQERIKSYIRDESSQAYTAAERAMGIENVRTGLKRNLDDESEDEEEDEDDEDENEDDEDNMQSAQAGADGDDDVMVIDPPSQLQAAPIRQVAVKKDDAPTQSGFEPEFALWYAMRGEAGVAVHIDLEKQLEAKEAKKKRPGRP